MPDARPILILEDSILLAMDLEAVLADRGHLAVTAGSLAAARSVLGVQPPAAALLDYVLPDGNSLALAHELRESGCPVAILSGMDDHAIPADAPFQHFTKPADRDAVLAWLEAALRPLSAADA